MSRIPGYVRESNAGVRGDGEPVGGKAAPQLTGKAQQAYAAMRAEDAGTYQLLKEAILRRYDVSDETYRQRFRETVKKEDETVSELAVRLDDLLQKWTKDCKTVAEVRDLMVREQLLNALPRDQKIWVSERKPKTSTEAADMADNYVRARKQERDPEVKRESRRENTGMKPWPRGQRDSERRSGLPSTARGENILRRGPKGDTGSGGGNMLQLWQEGTHIEALP